MDRYECKPCKRGPSPWEIWPIRRSFAGFYQIYCPTCQCVPVPAVEPVLEPETVVVLDLNGDFRWPVEIGENGGA